MNDDELNVYDLTDAQRGYLVKWLIEGGMRSFDTVRHGDAKRIMTEQGPRGWIIHHGVCRGDGATCMMKISAAAKRALARWSDT